MPSAAPFSDSQGMEHEVREHVLERDEPVDPGQDAPPVLRDEQVAGHVADGVEGDRRGQELKGGLGIRVGGAAQDVDQRPGQHERSRGQGQRQCNGELEARSNTRPTGGSLVAVSLEKTG